MLLSIQGFGKNVGDHIFCGFMAPWLLDQIMVFSGNKTATALETIATCQKALFVFSPAGINVSDNLVAAVWLVQYSPILCPLKVPNNSLEGPPVCIIWIFQRLWQFPDSLILPAWCLIALIFDFHSQIRSSTNAKAMSPWSDINKQGSASLIQYPCPTNQSVIVVYHPLAACFNPYRVFFSLMTNSPGSLIRALDTSLVFELRDYFEHPILNDGINYPVQSYFPWQKFAWPWPQSWRHFG